MNDTTAPTTTATAAQAQILTDRWIADAGERIAARIAELMADTTLEVAFRNHLIAELVDAYGRAVANAARIGDPFPMGF